MNHTEKRSSAAARIGYRIAWARRVLRLVPHMRLALTAGFALLLCLTWAGCSGFFISPSISSIFISPPAATINISNTVQLNATARYSDGSSGPIQGASVGWSSSATNLATVTSPGGLVTGVSTGTATITATDQGVTATASVTVTPMNVTSISITTTQGSTNPQSTATISGVPNTLQFYAYANGSSLPANDLTQAVTWSSSNTSVATISSGLSGGGNGLATSVATGTTNIIARIMNTTNGTTITSNTIALTVQ
jgi:hypothetical protein